VSFHARKPARGGNHAHGRTHGNCKWDAAGCRALAQRRDSPPEQIKAFRDTWELGIHSYLTYLRDRLAAARDLLTESGSIFVEIGDEDVHLVRSVMDEVFSSQDFCSIITVSETAGQTAEGAEGAEKTRKRSEIQTPLCSSAPSAPSAVSFLPMILDNLRKAGVKGTDRSQRITFARLDPFPSAYIQAEGETGAAVRVCVGPEFGTLGDGDIARAALEAVKGSRCDLLLVCAFAFEPSVHEQTAELTKEIKFGKLAVLPVRMNPDLAMGDELLKKTGAGNLFTVLGEPDVTITKGPASRERERPEQWVVTIRGVDVFDPTTGAVRTGDTDDIACWFIDTDYDGQSFFVRHAYFLYGGKGTSDGPYDKLRKALRAEIDEGEWSKLYRAVSQPFDPPQSGKIAVKVINHFGDEVLKVYPVPAATSKR
jgi:hypothetical protein